jgi:putative membrane protein
MKRLSILLAVIGLILGVALIGWFGVDSVTAAIGRIGPREFALIVGWQLVLFVILGLAWDVIAPPEALRRPWVLIWARMVRDASATCLPFSQLGGFVFGARAATLHGMTWQTATASVVVDVTAEFLAQIAFAAIGLGILLAHAPSSDLVVPLEIGIGLAVIGGFAFVMMQQGAGNVFAALGRRIAGNRFDNAQEKVAILQAEVALIYGHTPRLIIGFALHLLGWIGTGFAGWLTLRLLGVPINFDQALAIEALLAAVAAIAFLVPVNAGVQEAGYVGLGALFGVPPEMAIATSLIRRARDVVLGLPILLVWQLVEVRRLRAGREPASDRQPRGG